MNSDVGTSDVHVMSIWSTFRCPKDQAHWSNPNIVIISSLIGLILFCIRRTSEAIKSETFPQLSGECWIGWYWRLNFFFHSKNVCSFSIQCLSFWHTWKSNLNFQASILLKSLGVLFIFFFVKHFHFHIINLLHFYINITSL